MNITAKKVMEWILIAIITSALIVQIVLFLTDIIGFAYCLLKLAVEQIISIL